MHYSKAKLQSDCLVSRGRHSFFLGCGVLWNSLNVTGSEAGCPYKGVHGNAEFQAISGCPTVLVDSDCVEWDRWCMSSELMTNNVLYLSNPPLSRITVGSLQDMGYNVSYSKADSFGRADLDPHCRCNRRSLVDMSHSETHQLGLDIPKTVRRVLSDAKYQAAMDYGLAILEKMHCHPTCLGMMVKSDTSVTSLCRYLSRTAMVFLAFWFNARADRHLLSMVYYVVESSKQRKVVDDCRINNAPFGLTSS